MSKRGSGSMKRLLELEAFAAIKHRRGNPPEHRLATMTARRFAPALIDSDPDEDTREIDAALRKERAEADKEVQEILSHSATKIIDETVSATLGSVYSISYNIRARVNDLSESELDDRPPVVRHLRAAKFEWHLHPNLHLPIHLPDHRCEVCDTYLEHLDSRGKEVDYAPDADMEEDAAGEYDFESALMQKLFLIRDLRARDAAFNHMHNDPRAAGELRGSLLNAHIELAKLRRERDTAVSEHAVLQHEVEALGATNELLQARQQDTSEQLQAALVAQKEAACSSRIVQAEMEALRDANTKLSKERDEALVEVARVARVAQIEQASQKHRLDSALDEARTLKELAASDTTLLHLRTERDTALSRHAVLQREVEILGTTNEQLQARQQDLSEQLQAALAAQQEAVCASGIAQNQIQVLHHTNTRLSKERDEALVEGARVAGVEQASQQQRLALALDEARIFQETAAAALSEVRALKDEIAAHAVATSASQWQAMKLPSRHQPIETLARWIQFNETHIPGITFHPEFAIDMRDLRGYREVQSRLGPKDRADRQLQRKTRRDTESEIVGLLAAPGEYHSLLLHNNISISPVIKYEPHAFIPPLTPLKVAYCLADQGMTLAVADDTQQYAYKVLKDAANSGVPAAVQRLAFIDARQARTPPGLYTPELDRFARPVDLPSKHDHR
ncbi:hypothetical protein C8R46DRAFT_1206923 [Mycena filopes]|nr:hypothetical protein C8R46DRAFT_1206923 [Mycena filopes]